MGRARPKLVGVIVTPMRAKRAVNARRAERLGAALATRWVAADFVTGATTDFARVCSSSLAKWSS